MTDMQHNPEGEDPFNQMPGHTPDDASDDTVAFAQVEQNQVDNQSADNDEKTLAAAPARKFEPVSLSGYESVGIVRFLMLIDKPNQEIIDSTGHVISWGRIVDRGHGEIDHGQYDNDLEVMGAMAACALYKCEMLRSIGLLDTSYVTLGEDADLSWRAHNQGWKATYTPKAVVYHKRGQTITRKSVLPEMTVLSLKNTVKLIMLQNLHLK